MSGLDDLKDFRRTTLRNAPTIRKTDLKAVPFVTLMTIMIALSAMIAWFAVTTAMGESDAAERTRGMLVAVAASVLGAFFLGGAIASFWSHGRRWRQRRAAAELALARGWHYNLEIDPRSFPATLFARSGRNWVENSLHVHEPMYIEVANYVGQTTQRASGREEYGFIGIGIDRRLPHMYLESAARQKRARAYPIPFRPDQRLSLEGDFDRWFRLYCPKEYETDALYVITPDVMALMIDEAAGFDIEIVDDWLFVIARAPFDMADPAVLDFAERLAGTLGRRTEHQSTGYRDDRSEEPGFIDAAGARLRRGRLLLTVLPPAIAVVTWVGWFWIATTGLG